MGGENSAGALRTMCRLKEKDTSEDNFHNDQRNPPTAAQITA